MKKRPRKLRGFTLIELLVVIAIIAILVAMLLPAVQQVREAARKSQCQDHLHNLAIAMHDYEVSFGTYCPGSLYHGPNYSAENNTHPIYNSSYFNRGPGWSWSLHLLPFVEAKPLYDQFNINIGPFADVVYDGNLTQRRTNVGDAANRDPSRSMPDVFVCPSVPLAEAANRHKDYGINGGEARCCPERMLQGSSTHGARNGVAYRSSDIRVRDLTDGTSHTVMFGEQAHNIKHNGAASGTDVPTNPFILVIHSSDGYFGGFYRPNEWANISGRWARGYHPGGLQVAMCDGVVTFVSDNVDRNVWRDSMSRNGREPNSIK